jgi:glycosyltransferase involved in cell wall biosynthesis
MRLAYLYSRYPVVSQTFCDMEMLEVERRGFDLLIGSVHSPLTSLRHEHLRRLKAPIRYAPPQSVLKLWEKKAKADGRWPQALIDAHEKKYGAPFKAALRARNALYFADLFQRAGIDHVHVHFANRAAHTAIFLKELSGIPFSITAHGQDFMSDLAQDDLLREICAAAEFVAVETDYSRKLLQERCPESAGKIHRVYNGMDLANFSNVTPENNIARPPLILSVGRLVAFKGFENLIAACALLRAKGLDFRCEIIGDGPLREILQTRIEQEQLNSHVTLRGSLSQAQVFESLQRCDVFALASIVDEAGASDVFPTVIQEAMACARPVVSTRLAGIPETVIGGETGFLVSPGDVSALMDALEKLLHSRGLRLQLGDAGKARIEKHFRIETTIAPLLDLFQGLERKSVSATHAHPVQNKIAYLIDLWPDDRLPILEKELLEMERRGVGITALVCRTPDEPRFTASMEQLAPRFQFLPDAMAIEAEWRSNSELAQRLENDRASETERAPADVFLQQARFALALRKLIEQEKILHLHATSSRALICGVMLKKMYGLSLSATIESQPPLARGVIESALKHCAGGRTNDRELSERFGNRLTFETAVLGIGLSRSDRFWREWAQLLLQWSGQTSNA